MGKKLGELTAECKIGDTFKYEGKTFKAISSTEIDKKTDMAICGLCSFELNHCHKANCMGEERVERDSAFFVELIICE